LPQNFHETIKKPPQQDELEVTLFGPGFGECLIVHVGGDEWCVVDSCRTDGESVAISYLRGLGVDVTKAIKLIVATHWHDDHIAGLSDLVAHAQTADFVVSAALSHEDFLSLVYAYRNRTMMRSTTGMSEWEKILVRLEKETGFSERLIYASDGKLLFRRSIGSGPFPCEILALSPTNAACSKALASYAALLPKAKQPMKRVGPLDPNHGSIVLWISCGEERILLGADLEETGEQGTGWSVVVESKIREGAASVFKVPHHGSSNGHHEAVWNKLLGKAPFAILTPYTRLKHPLPTAEDIKRITKLTPNSYVTRDPLSPDEKIRISKTIDKTISEATRKARRLPSTVGVIRLRRSAKGIWTSELFGTACPLKNC